MSNIADAFNRTGFSRFINRRTGRAFRLAAGTAFLVVGWIYRAEPLGQLSMAWSVLPLSSSLFDLCYVSGALGGPFAGKKIRACQAMGDAAEMTPPPRQTSPS
jgi:hypothetical protein